MTRPRLTRKERADLFEDHFGICHMCKQPISCDERWEVSHPIPLGLGGADDPANRGPAHYRCHRRRTFVIDVPAIAKAKRAAQRPDRKGRSPRLLRIINRPVIKRVGLRARLSDARSRQKIQITVEDWKPVVGFEGRYEVSNFGRVRSVNRIAISHRKEGSVERRLIGQLLRPGAQKPGHLTVAIGRGNSRLVHALVLEAFVGPRPNDMEGLHRDDNPTNNRLDNLRWGTRSDNLFDAVRNGKKANGERVWSAKLTEDAVRFIKTHASDQSMSSLARRFGVTISAVRQVMRGITWRHIQ